MLALLCAFLIIIFPAQLAATQHELMLAQEALTTQPGATPALIEKPRKVGNIQRAMRLEYEPGKYNQFQVSIHHY